MNTRLFITANNTNFSSSCALSNDMVDKCPLSFPDITHIFQACKYKKRMAAHQNMINDKFERCYLEFADGGILTNELQEQIEIPANMNYSGDNINC